MPTYGMFPLIFFIFTPDRPSRPIEKIDARGSQHFDDEIGDARRGSTNNRTNKQSHPRLPVHHEAHEESQETNDGKYPNNHSDESASGRGIDVLHFATMMVNKW